MKQFMLLLTAVIFTFAATAQIKSSPFKPVPKQVHYSASLYGVASNPTVTAWRFTPAAGYNLTTKQLMAGLGYGVQWMHFVDSTQKYYTTFSIQGIGWVNGNTTPSLNPPNFASFGISAGFLNQLVMAGFAYTPPTFATKGKIGLVVNFAIPLNN